VCVIKAIKYGGECVIISHLNYTTTGLEEREEPTNQKEGGQTAAYYFQLDDEIKMTLRHNAGIL